MIYVLYSYYLSGLGLGLYTYFYNYETFKDIGENVYNLTKELGEYTIKELW